MWVQGSIQGTTGNSYLMPFGGTAVWDLQANEFVVDPTSPMVQGVSSPFSGNFGSHADYQSGLPGGAHIVVRAASNTGFPSLYDFRPSVPCAGTATVTPTRTPTGPPPATNTPTRTATCAAGGGGGTPGPWRTSTPGPAPGHYRLGATSVGQYVYVYGGGTSTLTGDNILWRWDSVAASRPR